ncbi:urea ABC transporter permease subunit UrtB [Rhodobacteraceae bacterium WD3A24]|nr:urea ABC transporter permease subunit UrtB [Rhodobacteraceae bacterium WD3A24]
MLTILRTFLGLVRRCAIWVLVLSGPTLAQDGDAPLQPVLQNVRDEIANPSRSSVDRVLDALTNSDATGVVDFLRAWQDRAVYTDPATGLFYYAREESGDLVLIDIDSGAEGATVSTRDVEHIRPNGGVRREVAASLVQFEVSSPDPERRRAALEAIGRSPDAEQIAYLAASIGSEPDPEIRARKERLLTLLSARFAPDVEDRVAAIETLSGDVSTEARAVLSQILATRQRIAESLPQDVNMATVLEIGSDLGVDAAYGRLVDAGLAPERTDTDSILAALRANVVDGAVGGIPLHQLDTEEARETAYRALSADGLAPQLFSDAEVADAVGHHEFFEEYVEPNEEITDAARAAVDGTGTRIAIFEGLSLAFDALSLGSIFFLAAVGLAVTFGVMRVINMAHGEFIMMGAYTGYVIQLFVPDHTLSLVIALPMAFLVAFAAGVALERLVIRHLYTRPLETLLATFGISIALQQLAKNIFGTQARPLTAPDWLAGSIALNDIVSVATIRVAIFVLALIFLVLLLLVLKRTRLGLEVRAVTQNPGMAASMGIDPDRINMLTFGLGSGIAGIAGVAIGLYAQVTSEMGANYIVQSFMTVVVGGVGNVWGTLAGAGMIGFLQKGIEWFNPSNTLVAQTYLTLFIILFIQFRPRGIFALKGRAAGD